LSLAQKANSSASSSGLPHRGTAASATIAPAPACSSSLAYEPKLLLLDEITSALDPELVGEVLALVGELAAGGSTIVMADTVYFLDGGRIVESGSAKQVLTDPRQDRTRQFLRRFTGGQAPST
jgi:polar amino acid transport system ATP-binding protein